VSPFAAASPVKAKQLMSPLKAITLSSQRQITGINYGVQCMLHVEDTHSRLSLSIDRFQLQ
jgi:hypothetical protein